jgi:glutamate-1-semialdehyde 2,1-aminomutase
MGQTLARGIERIGRDANIPARVLGDGPVLQVFFTDQREMFNHRATLKADKQKATQFGYELIRRGVYCAPGGKLYLSLAHSDEDLSRTLEVVEEAIRAVRQ